MSNLKDLFISQSFYGIINLENSTSPITSQSGDVELQDGIGTNLGLRTNADNKKFTVVNNFQVDGNADFNGDIDISGSFVHSGSIDVLGNVTVNGDISANIATFDTVNTRLLHVTEESASVIFSSGSNVIGDETSDTQTIVGQTTISGSLGLLNGTNLTVDGNISSSTVSGIGNVTTYSASVDTRINNLPTTGSNTFVGDNTFSGSVNGEVNSLTIASQTASLDLSNGNFFTLELISGSDTHLVTSNIQAGQTITLKIKQPNTGFGTISYSNDFKFVTGSTNQATEQSNAIDILTLLTYDNTSIFGTLLKTFV